ncbi:DUF7427 family protein [Nocardia amamiensis]|uniref:DUF7427 family protein n=1 Tax=Nocardia TaxID=1817 RepID=UPI0033CCB156
MALRVSGGGAFTLFTVAWIAYDAAAPEGEMLTDAARRVQRKHPVAWAVAVLVTGAHLLDAFRFFGIPECDPYTRIAHLAQRMRELAGRRPSRNGVQLEMT